MGGLNKMPGVAMKNIVIAILDSGLDLKCTDHIVGGVQISISKDHQIQLSNDFDDKFGHGTAIYHILNDSCPNIYFYIVKIFDNEFLEDSTLLLEALKHMLSVDCDFIIISSGTYVIDDVEEFTEIIENLTQQNKIIVSAFSNDGGLSYPAAHQNVIGVDVSKDIPANTICIVKNSPIQLILPDKKYRLKWLNGNKVAISTLTLMKKNKKHKKHKQYIIHLLTTKSKTNQRSPTWNHRTQSVHGSPQPFRLPPQD